MTQAHGEAVCDSKHKCSNSVVHVYYVSIFLIQMNKSINGVNSLVSLTERYLTFGKTNELSK